MTPQTAKLHDTLSQSTPVDFIDSTQWSGHIIGICLAPRLSLIGQERERAPLIISST